MLASRIKRDHLSFSTRISSANIKWTDYQDYRMVR